MNKASAGSGEAMERLAKRKKWIIIGGLIVVGLVTGFLAGFYEADGLLDGGGWPPSLALGIAFSYLAAIVGGGIAMTRQMDEVELQTQTRAVSFAAGIYIIVYPSWFVLWKGGFVVEPIHWALFVIFWLALALSSLYYRYR